MKLVWALFLMLPLSSFAQSSKALTLRASVPSTTTITITPKGEAIVRTNSLRYVLRPHITVSQKNQLKLVTVVHP